MANRLAALTSLRFFAAAAIVYHHVMGAWAFPRVPEFLFAQGVSFFFVLSGFILTYRYPLLRDWPEIGVSGLLGSPGFGRLTRPLW